ncbi:hypothetical protein HPB47_009096 [Ixodes persulcatus]|uniref:Uncharacterized protein n=1 Tax=Ixodes persulcatus TaxID=34615 RepID=A0AC60P315_IXOPE|nr:hypothetical protein HPB47_009096 [Ixodes persulcatus]
MGCAAAKRDFSWTNKSNDKPTNLSIGDAVRPCHDLTKGRLIFVFGGPGSRKGQIVNDLAHCFGFETVSAEKLILAHFTKQLEADPQNCSEIYTTRSVELLLKSEPKLLTLWLLLELVERELELQREMKPDVAFFVDPMPNLRYMVPAKRELEDCREELERFELQWPCLFALDLDVAETSLKAATGKETRRALGDEKDFAKTKKRLQDYKDSVKGFLKYFQEDQRVVKVHVDQNPGPVSPQLVQLFTALGFLPRCALDPSFVFLPVVPGTKNKRRCSRSSTNENEMVPHEWFQEDEPDKPVAHSLPSAGNGPSTPTVASVDSSALPGSEQNQMSSADKEDRRVLFKGDEQLGWTQPLQAVRTTWGEVCLFPGGTDWATCRRVAIQCARHLRWQCTLRPP